MMKIRDLPEDIRKELTSLGLRLTDEQSISDALTAITLAIYLEGVRRDHSPEREKRLVECYFTLRKYKN